jgi:hypothetical protein
LVGLTKKCIFAVVLSVLTFSFSAYSGTYSGGSGTSEDPYKISDVNDMNEIGANPDDWDDHFILTADIDMSGFEYTTALIAPDTNNSTAGFQGTAFAGVFDGAGYVISNLTIDDTGAGNDFLGLFGIIDGTSVQIINLGLVDVNVSGNSYVASLAGYNKQGNISNCNATGSVSGNNNIGGLVGFSRSSAISNCSASGTISGNNYLGGLVGVSFGGSISNCYATGSVSGDDYLGGLVGENRGFISNCYVSVSIIGGVDSVCLGGLVGSNWRTISNCYANGTVSSGIGLGGLVGFNYYGTISNCYASGSVSGDNALGGLVGYNEGLDSTSHCYFLETTGPDNGYGSPLTDAQMQQQSSFVGWDFVGETASGTSQIWF